MKTSIAQLGQRFRRNVSILTRRGGAAHVMNILCRSVWRFIAIAIVFGPVCAGRAAADTPQDLRPFVEALAHKGCASDRQYRTIAGVLCPKAASASGASDPDAVLQSIGASTRQRIQAFTLQARKEDAACAGGAASIGGGGTSVGPRNADELAQTVVRNAVKDAASFTLPVGTMLSIPGVTQVEYDYKGLSNGPEVRSFKISGHVEGKADQAKLYLQMYGAVEGDRNLYVEYMVNYRGNPSPFPAWSPFLDRPGTISPGFVRMGLNTLSATASFSETGEHRNGVQPWHKYEYTLRAEKVGASPKDIVKSSGGVLTDLARYPYGGDWVGVGWGSETRFEQTRRAFVSQFCVNCRILPRRHAKDTEPSPRLKAAGDKEESV